MKLSAYVFGKHGSDLLIPGVGIKVIKGAMGELKLLANAANATSKADAVYILESAFGTVIKINEKSSLVAVTRFFEAPINTLKFLELGRGLMKHGYREDSVFPKPVGNPSQVNIHGQKILEEILNSSEKEISTKMERFLKIEVIDIKIPGKGGVRFNAQDYSFIGFLEP